MMIEEEDKVQKKEPKYKVFDWVQAARFILEYNATVAEAGLAEDWDNTAGIIYSDNKPVYDTYTFLLSHWAMPKILIEDKFLECWKWKDTTNWDAKTKWPESSLKILRKEA